MALVIDVATAKTAAGTSTNTLTSSAFTTAATGELVVAIFAATQNDVAQSPGTITATVSGAGLTWTLAKRSNAKHQETAEVWYAVASGILTAQTVTATVTITQGLTRINSALEVLTFTGANTGSPIGASNTASNPTGTTANPSITLATTAGSYAVAAGATWDNAVTIAVAGQTLLADDHDTTVGSEEWAQRSTAATGTSTTMSATGLGSNQWDFAAVEILAAAGAIVLPPRPIILRQAVQRAANF